MAEAPSLLDTLFECIDRVRRDQCEVTDPDKVWQRLRLVQELVARLPHKHILAATREEIRSAGRTMIREGRGPQEMKALQATLVAILDLLWQEGTLARHPLRPHEIRRSLRPRPPEGVLGVGLPVDAVARVRSTVEAGGMVLHAVGSADGALDRVGWYPFAHLVIRFPLYAPARLFDALRGELSLCRSAGVVLVAEDDALEDAGRFVGRGANRVLDEHELEAGLGRMIDELATISERTRLRVPVRAELPGGVEEWQSENISATGLLVRTCTELEVGSVVDLRLRLPPGGELVEAAAEVVRRTTFGHEDFDGLGLRFLSFVGEGQHAIETFMRRGL